MALIKSSQLIKTGTAVVAGNEILPDAPEYQAAPGGPASLERLVPPAAEATDEAQDGQEYPEYEDPQALEPDGLVYEEPLDESGEFEDEAPGDEFDEANEPLVAETPELLEDFEGMRAELIAAQQQTMEQAVEEAVSELGRPDASAALAEMSAQVAAVYPKESPAFESTVRQLTPIVEEAVQAAHDEITALAAQDARWRETCAAEEQMAHLIDNFLRRVLDDPPPAQALHSLLSEREAILAQARLQAASLLQGAEVQAAQLINQAQAKVAEVSIEVETTRERVLAELRQTGYAEGYQEGRSQADEEGAKNLQDAMAALDKLAGIFRVEVKKNEEKLLRLAIGIAEKLIMAELTQNQETVLRLMDEAINKVSDLEEVTLKVHPDDLPLVQQHEEAFRERLRNVRKVEFVANPKIQKGCVFIDTASGSVDATFKTQLSVIQESFDAVRAEYGAEPLDMTGSG